MCHSLLLHCYCNGRVHSVIISLLQVNHHIPNEPSIILSFFRIIPDPRYFGYSYLDVSNQAHNFSYYVDFVIDVVVSIYGGISYIAVSALGYVTLELTNVLRRF